MQDTEFLESAALARVVLDTGQARIVVGGLLDQPGVLARLFSALAESDIRVDLVVQDEIGEVSASVPIDRLPEAVELLERVLDVYGDGRILRHEPVAILSVAGTGLKSHGGVAATLFEALGTAGINIEMICTSEMAISAVIRHAEAEAGFDAVCRAFEFGEDEPDGIAQNPFTD